MKVKEFLKISDIDELIKLKAIKKGVKSRNYIKGHKSRGFIDYSYSKVQELKKWYQEGNLLYIASATTGIGQRSLLNSSYVGFVYFIKFIEEEIEKISMLEANLNKTDDAEEQMKLEAAGIEELKKFGSINIVDSLAGGDILKWGSIEQMPYKMVYTKLLKNKTDATIQKRYAELSRKTTKK